MIKTIGLRIQFSYSFYNKDLMLIRGFRTRLQTERLYKGNGYKINYQIRIQTN